MTRTTNISLPQWEASDAILRTDFNSAMSAIDTACANRIHAGSWSGNGASSRTIDLGCRPKLLIVLGKYNGAAAIGMVVPGLMHLSYSDRTSCDSTYFVLSGSTITINSSLMFNESGVTQRFVAIC